MERRSKLDFEAILEFDDARFEVTQDIGGADGGQHVGVSTGLLKYGVSIHVPPRAALSFIIDNSMLERHGGTSESQKCRAVQRYAAAWMP
jgi:hypothetical protein